ncbi:MAG: glycosidase [Candidatus Moraniibacteriota bacterium]|nr:MAG: glycosidase [Candidatus Moranbacteria bacterium]
MDFDDFKNARWNWHDTRLISLPGEINKNWVLFPEKIHGKFALLHSFYPNILIDYIDDLSQLGYGNCIKSNNQRPINPQRGWDSWFRGVGPSPIKTEYGWLVIYHAMDHRNPDRYRVGALLLDLNDPTIELCRTQHPILEPEAPYENGGIKWGVVYCCGAVVKDDTLFVYYGGSDTYVCVATAPLAQFLEQLRGGKEIKMYIH